MFYIIIAIAVCAAAFLSTSAFILGGAIAGLPVSLVCGITCVYWLGEVYEVWCEYD